MPGWCSCCCRGAAAAVVCLVALLLLAVPTLAAGEAEGNGDGKGGSAFVLQSLASREAVVKAISCLHTPTPTLILFTSEGAVLSNAAVTATLKNLTEQELLPAGFLSAAYRFQIDVHNGKDMALVDMVAASQDPRQPFLALYCSTLDSAYGVPGLPVTPFPSFLPRFYLGSPLHKKQLARLQQERELLDRDTGVPPLLSHGPSVRQWVMSESAVRWADPVTLAMLPAVHSVFSVEEVRTLLADEVSRWGSGHVGGLAGTRASRQPTVVMAAYVHLTTSGSAEIVAALNAASSQLGGAVLVLATEQREVAEKLGLSRFNTACVVAAAAAASSPSSSPSAFGVDALLAAVGVGGEAGGSGSRGKGQHSKEIPFLGGACVPTELVSPLAVGAFMRNLSAEHLASSDSALVTAGQQRTREKWRSDLKRFLSTSPLRKLTDDEALQRAFRSQSVKMLFFLRESDGVYFPRHFNLAVEVARRVTKQWIVFKTKSGESKALRPPFSIDVYWIDAERHPTVASQLRQTAVPSVVIALPLLSKEEEAMREEHAKQHHGVELPHINPNGFHGFHTVNTHDLRVQDDLAEGVGATAPSPTRKADLEPAYPDNSDELFRFIGGSHFIQRMQAVMLPYEAAHLTMGRGDGTAGEGPHREDNKGYLQVDYRYYAPSVAETEPPRYIRDVMSGELALPPYVGDSVESAGGPSAPPQSSAEKAKMAQAKEQWKAELARRQKEREERIRAKAAEDAERREQVRREIKEELIKELNREGETPDDTEKNGRSASRVPRPRPPPSSMAGSEKAALARRRRRAVAAATAWKDESHRMTKDYVVSGKGNQATIFHGLEAASTR